MVLVFRRLDNRLCTFTTKLNGTATHKIDNHDYKLNTIMKHHGEIISRGHCRAVVEYGGVSLLW